MLFVGCKRPAYRCFCCRSATAYDLVQVAEPAPRLQVPNNVGSRDTKLQHPFTDDGTVFSGDVIIHRRIGTMLSKPTRHAFVGISYL